MKAAKTTINTSLFNENEWTIKDSSTGENLGIIVKKDAKEFEAKSIYGYSASFLSFDMAESFIQRCKPKAKKATRSNPNQKTLTDMF